MRARWVLILCSFLGTMLLTACQASVPDPSTGRPVARPDQRAITYGGRTFRVIRNVAYATHAGVQLRLDVYRPTGHKPLPAVLDVHGGGWFSGSRRRATLPPLALADHNFVVFVPDYRLACNDIRRPLCGYHYRAPLKDVRAALEWMRSHGSDFHATTTSVAAVGTSAGGHLAQMLGVTGEEGGTRADAVVSWSGSSQLAVRARSPASFATVADYLGCGLRECPNRWRMMSPISHVSSASAPMMLVQSRRDPIVPASTARHMARALRRRRVVVRLWMRAGGLHARFGPRVLRESAHWLHRHM
ncbi:hypothetical protein BH18ACT15_BH18ACT15_04060 [soil metagenome]